MHKNLYEMASLALAMAVNASQVGVYNTYGYVLCNVGKPVESIDVTFLSEDGQIFYGT